MNILLAKKEDFKDLEKVEMSSGYHKKKFAFEKYLCEIYEKKAKIFCAEEKGKLVGYITLSKNGEINFLAVTKKFHGKGIGDKLIKKVISFSKNNKIKKLFLDVRNDNFPAIKLYLKNNFVITNIHKKKVDGKEITKLRMERIK